MLLSIIFETGSPLRESRGLPVFWLAGEQTALGVWVVETGAGATAPADSAPATVETALNLSLSQATENAAIPVNVPAVCLLDHLAHHGQETVHAAGHDEFAIELD